MGNYHAGFGSGGEGGDPLADHNEADTLIEVFQVACFGFVAFRVKFGGTAKPACGLCAIR